MKKAFRKIHLWLSVPFGVIITLICFSGAMLVFENEIMQMTHRHLYYVGKIGKKPIPMEQLAAKVSATLPDDVKVTGITVFPDPQKAYQINLSKPKRTSIYIDPYTGEIKGRNQRSPFFKAMFSLHRWLLDSRPEDGKVFWGKTIVGIEKQSKNKFTQGGEPFLARFARGRRNICARIIVGHGSDRSYMVFRLVSYCLLYSFRGGNDSKYKAQ